MKRLLSAILAASLTLSLFGFSVIADEENADAPQSVITGAVSAANTYSWQFHDSDSGNVAAYDYSDEFARIRVGVSANDNITAEKGIFYQSGSVLEPTGTKPNNVSDSNRYILIKPAYSGTLTIKIQFNDASGSRKCRLYYNDFDAADFDDVDLSTLVKGTGTQIGGDIADSGVKTCTFEMTAGHTYSLHTYNNSKTYISEMSYTSTDITATPAPTPEPTPTPTPRPGFTGAKEVEYLDRGTVAVKTDNGVFLSWRLLGTEETDTTFDIYKNGAILQRGLDATNYTDEGGTATDKYKVVVSGAEMNTSKTVGVWEQNYLDVPIKKPLPDPTNTKAGTDYTYSANDASVADVDGDGEYEIILKWDPSNSQDNYYSGYTGNVYIDAYEMDGSFLWRIDLGVNIRAGAHYTQFIAYDFDGDGKAEVAMRTAPGSKDGNGDYVTDAANGDILEGDNSKDYRNTDGRIIEAPDYLTIFNGETGEAMDTVDYYVQRGDLGKDGAWGGSGGDANSNYADRFLAGLAYVGGERASLVMCRGYYYRATVGVYDWDGTDLQLRWVRDDKQAGANSIYEQGAHSLSVADVDNDGYDEIIYGAATIDDDGSVLNNTDLRHGDALHVSDFDNDGKQEVFMSHEHTYRTTGAEYHDPVTGEVFAKINATEDVGRGVMENILASNPYAEFWSSSNTNTGIYDLQGNRLAERPEEVNFLSWWDGDLTREVLDATRIVKYDVENGSLVEKNRWELYGTHSNNTTKQTPSLSADILGDWREEAMYPTNDDNYLRIFTTTIPTDYKITTLMHDTQYRCAVAWQNVGYNQPPHPSFYIGNEKTDYPKPNVKYAVTPDITYPDTTERTVTFTIADGDGAEINIDGKTITAENGSAEVTLETGKKYDFIVVKEGFKTYSGTVDETAIAASITLEAGATGTVTLKYIDIFGNEIKTAETVGEADENALFTVPENNLADITTIDGTVYEFDPDATENTTLRVSGDKTISLIYKKKTAPVTGDDDITHINLGKNGFNKPANSSTDYKSSGGINYAIFDSNTEIPLSNAPEDSYIIEYDVILSDMTDGATVSVTPYAGSNAGTAMTFVREGGNVVLKLGDTECKYISENLKLAGYNENQVMRVVIIAEKEQTQLILLNRESGIIYVDYTDYDLGISGIDKLAIGAADSKFGLSEIKAYSVGGATDASYPFGESINMTTSSERSIAPVTVRHGTELDAKIRYPYGYKNNIFTPYTIDLADTLSYSFAENITGVSVDSNGKITVGSDASPGSTATAQILCNGHVFKTVTIAVVKGTRENFWTEDFESDTYKFALNYTDDAHKAAQFHCEDNPKDASYKRDGLIYGVGARNGGNTGTSSEEISANDYTDVEVEMDFKIDATAQDYSSYIALLGKKCTADSFSSDSRILVIRAFSGGGNGYFSEISANDKVFMTKIDDTSGSPETAGYGYDSGTKAIKPHALNRDSTGWMHLSAIPDFDTQQVVVTITKASDNSVVYSDVLDFQDEVSELKYIYASGGRSYGTVWLDNIAVSGINPNAEVNPSPEPDTDVSTETTVTVNENEYVLNTRINNAPEQFAVIIAAYNEAGNLLEVNIPDNPADIIETRFDKSDEISHFKIMVWNRLTEMKPISATPEIVRPDQA